ncbi:hypothetical protein [Shouchella lonarensis]|uniref:Uncharacterized protein n=1 Tax=Shouchella lonarensis TaxID=1464122 RepID=A0A1G6JNV9_9BACI|nr:hypothetical protein [Shouchella lonarensis]SDC20125.1 hypothetical protein SAMN05421737_10642 [Shouchella lonarensis]
MKVIKCFLFAAVVVLGVVGSHASAEVETAGGGGGKPEIKSHADDK